MDRNHHSRAYATSSRRQVIKIEDDFQGGLTLAASGVRIGMLAAIELGLVATPDATKIPLLIREASKQLADTMHSDG